MVRIPRRMTTAVATVRMPSTVVGPMMVQATSAVAKAPTSAVSESAVSIYTNPGGRGPTGEVTSPAAKSGIVR